MKIILKKIFFLLALAVSSCVSNNEKITEQKVTTEREKQETNKLIHKPKNNSKRDQLSLDDFNGIPNEIEGCSCYFSKTDQKFKDNVYLFVAGFDSIGFVSVDKQLVKLKLVSTEREPHSFGDYDHVDNYESDFYKVSIDIKFKNYSGDETWWNYGKIVLERRDGQKTTERFVGECGC